MAFHWQRRGRDALDDRLAGAMEDWAAGLVRRLDRQRRNADDWLRSEPGAAALRQLAVSLEVESVHAARIAALLDRRLPDDIAR